MHNLALHLHFLAFQLYTKILLGHTISAVEKPFSAHLKKIAWLINRIVILQLFD
jgi:hypothetical protein